MSPARCLRCSGITDLHPDGTPSRCGWCGHTGAPATFERPLEGLIADVTDLAKALHGEDADLRLHRGPDGWIVQVETNDPDGPTGHEWAIKRGLAEALRCLEGLLIVSRATQQRRAALTLVAPANDTEAPRAS